MKNKIKFVSSERMLECIEILNFLGYSFTVPERNIILFENEETKNDAIEDVHNFHWCEGCTTGGSAHMSDADGCYYCFKCIEENENVYPEHNESYLEQ